LETALVLISLYASMEYNALSELKKVGGVKEAHFLYGPYDAYALVEADSSHQLQEVVIGKIRNIDGIRSTVTCFVAE